MGDDILSDFGIHLLEEEIDDVIFQTNEFLTDATFTGAQGPFWWLLVDGVILRFLAFISTCKSTTFKILFRETNPRRDKNGTKPQENKIKNALCPEALVTDSSFHREGTILSHDYQTFLRESAVIQGILLPFGICGRYCKWFNISAVFRFANAR